MINIALPMAGVSEHFDSEKYHYPKPLIEVGGVPMIQLVVDNLRMMSDDVHFIFVVRKEDCVRHYLHNTLRLIAGEDSTIIQIEQNTKGAACSLLMAIEEINSDTPLVVANSDQVFEEDLKGHLAGFAERGADAGCLCFDSVHPRWSSVKLIEDVVQEASEKNPISRNAIAGFYYFQQGGSFIADVMKMILKQASINGSYYVAPVFNELLLEGKLVTARMIDGQNFHTFYNPQRIEEYERKLQ